jgi:Rrf2 family protein
MLCHKGLIDGLSSVCYLSRQEPGMVIPASAVAEAMEVPPEQAAKVLQSLANAGIVQSVRGRSGGYKLTRSPESITLAEVMDALVAPTELPTLEAKLCSCLPGGMCQIRAGLRRLRDRMRALMESQTIADLIADSEDEVCPSHALPDVQVTGHGTAASPCTPPATMAVSSGPQNAKNGATSDPAPPGPASTPLPFGAHVPPMAGDGATSPDADGQ